MSVAEDGSHNGTLKKCLHWSPKCEQIYKS